MINNILRLRKIVFTHQDYLHGITTINSVGELLYAIIYHYEHPTYPEKEENMSFIKQRIVEMFDAKRTPTFINSHNWGYPVLCQSFALIKTKTELWNMFTVADQKRITQCMKMFLYMWNFGCNEKNRYDSGWGMHGNYFKFANSNYELTNNIMLPFLVSFFNDSADTLEILNSMVMNLNWEEEKAQLQQLGFDNALKFWDGEELILPDGSTCSAKRLITEGGPCVIKSLECGEINYNDKGTGKGVKTPIAYKTKSPYFYDNIPDEIVETVLEKCYSLTCQTQIPIKNTNIICDTANHTTSPYEGQKGMMLEFLSVDKNTRSSLFHCAIDFVLTISLIKSLQLLNIKDITTSENWEQIKVGVEDFLFKYENNYQGYSMGQLEKTNPIEIDLWRDYWEKHYR